MIRQHHEHFNGNGYPDKLKGNQINIEARIVAIADAIDAMSSDRPYRKALSPLSIVAELKKHAGSQFDPLIVDKVLKMTEFQDKLREANSEIQPDLMCNFTISLPPS
jgi:HD-GYP domain-containing protein (c-di-GMP phosphodiesterase class II)